MGGLVAAGCMTALRMAARRYSLIEKTVPQATEEWVAEQTGTPTATRPLAHHVADHFIHFGYSALLGGVYGALRSDQRARSSGKDAGLGFGLWAATFSTIAPVLGISKPLWRATVAENLVNAVAHTVYGAVTALVYEELLEQSEHHQSSERERRRTAVG